MWILPKQMSGAGSLAKCTYMHMRVGLGVGLLIVDGSICLQEDMLQKAVSVLCKGEGRQVATMSMHASA